MPRANLDFDYIIVGGGPAGCVLANRLSADSSRRVLLLEAGTGNAPLSLRLLARFTNWFDLKLRWPYETVAQEGMKGRRIYLPQGRALGGGSVVNAMTYVRGQPGDYDGWRRLGNDGWGYETVLSAFKRLENNAALLDRFHGRGGALWVSDQVQPHPLTRVFVEAGREVGLPYNRDFNGISQDGIGTYQVTQVNGKRCSAADAFLRPILWRTNLTVLTHACATKIRVSHGRATGIEFLQGTNARLAHATTEVIVSGGAINSPKLLLLSGVGPAADLHRLGIPVVHELPGVGKNLHDHLNVQVIARCTRPITYDHWDRPLPFLKFGLEFLLFNTGRATSNICEGGAFLRSDADLPSPDIQLSFIPLIWHDSGRTKVPGHGLTLDAAFLNPESRGTVTLASADPLAFPLIDPRYCTTALDVRTLVEAIRRCREIFGADPFREFVRTELFPGPQIQSNAGLSDYVRASGSTTYHPVGTCKMGRDELAVVDPQLRVHGLEALRVVDSSIMPRIVRGSTQAPSMMIGEMGATMILAKSAAPVSAVEMSSR